MNLRCTNKTVPFLGHPCEWLFCLI